MTSYASLAGLIVAATDRLLRRLPPGPFVDLAGRVIAPHLIHRAMSDLGGWSLFGALGELLGPLPRWRREQVAREIVLNELKNVYARKWRATEPNPFVPFVHSPSAELLRSFHERRRPVVLTFCHAGAHAGLRPPLLKAGVPALILAARLQQRSPAPINGDGTGVHFLELTADPASWVMGLKRAVEYLQKGGVVAAASDGFGGAQRHVPASFLGRQLSVSTAPAVLARLTGARIFPVVVSWDGAGWAYTLHVCDPPPLPQGREATDRAVMTRLAGWFDAYVRAHPEQLRFWWLARVLRHPRWRPEEAHGAETSPSLASSPPV
jgi:lauroyl/myristoyl acyltransferase